MKDEQEGGGYDGHLHRLKAVLGSMLFCQGQMHQLKTDRDQAAKISSSSASKGRTRTRTL
jgi:lipopolysaccharide export system protein LptA